MAIDAVLFDYSGLLTTSLHLPTENVPYDPDAVFVEMAAALASPDTNPWHELERGEITLASYIDYVEARVPGAGALFAVDSEHNVMANLEVLDHRMAVAASVKARGLATGLVTNNVAEWQSFWRPRLPAGVFDVVIDSADVGHRKPEPEIYRLAMARLDVEDASAVLFVDDFEWNVAGAEAVGMVGLHYMSDMDLQSKIDELLSFGSAVSAHGQIAAVRPVLEERAAGLEG